MPELVSAFADTEGGCFEMFNFEQDATLIMGNCIDVLLSLQRGVAKVGVGSPPYWGLRNYKADAVWGGKRECDHVWVKSPSQESWCSRCGAWYGQFGLEGSHHDYLYHTQLIAEAMHHAIADDGSVFWVVNDSYMNKRLMLIPEGICRAFETAGWVTWGRGVWHKPNSMPSSVGDRLSSTYEFVLQFVKSAKHYCSHKFVEDETVLNQFGHRINAKKVEGYGKYLTNVEPFSVGRENCDHAIPPLLSINTRAFKGAHTAPYPMGVTLNPIASFSRPGDTVLDPFVGTGTTMAAARILGRKSIGIELNKDYVKFVDGKLKDALVARANSL